MVNKRHTQQAQLPNYLATVSQHDSPDFHSCVAIENKDHRSGPDSFRKKLKQQRLHIQRTTPLVWELPILPS